MRSRATSTSDRGPTWKAWLLQEYARYWYGLGVMLVLVFGVAEFARLGAPLGAIHIVGLLLLCIAIVAGGFAGYLALWRRDTEEAQLLFRGLARLRRGRGAPVSHPQAAMPDGRSGDEPKR